MTEIVLSKIAITSSQIWVKLNGVSHCLGLFETSVILGHATEKTIEVTSREFHKHNNRQSFENDFMLKLYCLLDNTNHNLQYSLGKSEIMQYPFWIIDKIDKTDSYITVIIRNLNGEQIIDQ